MERSEERWYVLQTRPGNEEAACGLLTRLRRRNPKLCFDVRILKKRKVFRSGGALHVLEDRLFPGYLFVRTAQPEELRRALDASRALPRFFCCESGREEIVPVEAADLAFLQSVCGQELQQPMGITEIAVGEHKEILRPRGVLKPYVSRVVRLNLHKRFAVAEIPLFNRRQEILFAIRLEQDRTEPGTGRAAIRET